MAGRRGRTVYRDHQWTGARSRALARAAYRCQVCGGAGRLEVHHRRPLAVGGAAFAIDNLEVRCRRCHFAAHHPPRHTPWDRLVNELLVYRVQVGPRR